MSYSNTSISLTGMPVQQTYGQMISSAILHDPKAYHDAIGDFYQSADPLLKATQVDLFTTNNADLVALAGTPKYSSLNKVFTTFKKEMQEEMSSASFSTLSSKVDLLNKKIKVIDNRIEQEFLSQQQDPNDNVSTPENRWGTVMVPKI